MLTSIQSWSIPVLILESCRCYFYKVQYIIEKPTSWIHGALEKEVAQCSRQFKWIRWGNSGTTSDAFLYLIELNQSLIFLKIPIFKDPSTGSCNFLFISNFVEVFSLANLENISISFQFRSLSVWLSKGATQVTIKILDSSCLTSWAIFFSNLY